MNSRSLNSQLKLYSLSLSVTSVTHISFSFFILLNIFIYNDFGHVYFVLL